MGRRRLFAALTALAAAAAALVAAEVLVRLTVGMPAAVEPRDAGLPSLHEPDLVLGWRNKAARVVWPGRGPDEGRPIVYTFEPGGRRATGVAPVRDRPAAVLVGCSYTQGWAVTDDETFAWRLQDRFPALAVVNLGTAGYGTHQSLLALERFLAAGGHRTALVVYGFIENHELRNVAPALWLRALATATAAGPLAVPFATLDPGGRLRRHAPERYPDWPLDDRLASVALLEARVADWRTAPRLAQGRAVTEALLAELHALTTAHGATLVVAILEALPPARRHYAAWLAARDIEAVDCVDPRRRGPRDQVPGYGHPGREVNATWAACIGDAVAALAPDRP